jgi:hypothetical protein
MRIISGKAVLSLAFLLCIFAGSTAQGANVIAGEEWGYNIKIRQNRVEFLGGDIYNYSSFSSGALQLQLWALPRKYNGSRQTGRRMAKTSFAPLPGNSFYSSVYRKVRYYRPSRGRRYVTLILCESVDGTLYARHWVNMGWRRFY